MSTNHLYYFPVHNINGDVLHAYLRKFMDPTATIRPAYYLDSDDQQGYTVRSQRLVTKEDAKAIIQDSQQWVRERASGSLKALGDYLSSETWRQRFQEMVAPREPKPATTSSIRPSPSQPATSGSTRPTPSKSATTGLIRPSPVQPATGSVRPPPSQPASTGATRPSLAKSATTGSTQPSLSTPASLLGIFPKAIPATAGSQNPQPIPTTLLESYHEPKVPTAKPMRTTQPISASLPRNLRESAPVITSSAQSSQPIPTTSPGNSREPKPTTASSIPTSKHIPANLPGTSRESMAPVTSSARNPRATPGNSHEPKSKTTDSARTSRPIPTSLPGVLRSVPTASSQLPGHDRQPSKASGNKAVSFSQQTDTHDFASDYALSNGRHPPDHVIPNTRPASNRAIPTDRLSPAFEMSRSIPTSTSDVLKDHAISGGRPLNDYHGLSKQLFRLDLHAREYYGDTSDAESFDSNSTDSTIGSVFQVALGDGLTTKCIVDSGSSGNFLSEELLKKILSRMPEKNRDLKPYNPLKAFFSVLKGSGQLNIVGQIRLPLDWDCQQRRPGSQKAIKFKVVEAGQLCHSMIIKWKTAKKQGISLDDHTKGEKFELPYVATIPTVQLPKRNKDQKQQGVLKKKENRDKWEKAELARAKDANDRQGPANHAQGPANQDQRRRV